MVVQRCSYTPATEAVLPSIHYARSVISCSGAALRRHHGTLFNRDMEPKGDLFLKHYPAKILPGDHMGEPLPCNSQRTDLRFKKKNHSGFCGLPYYCAPPVCIPAVIGGLAVWQHCKPKPKQNNMRVLAIVVSEGVWEFCTHRYPTYFHLHYLRESAVSSCPFSPHPYFLHPPICTGGQPKQQW